LLYKLFDFQNWFGPKAMWLDFCDFHTDEDLLIWAHNLFGIAKDTGDKTFMEITLLNEYNGKPGSITRKRPSSSEANFYRDCYVIDTNMMNDPMNANAFTCSFLIQYASYIFREETLLNLIPTFVTEEEAEELSKQGEQTVHRGDFLYSIQA
jgi:hypothetical protein